MSESTNINNGSGVKIMLATLAAMRRINIFIPRRVKVLNFFLANTALASTFGRFSKISKDFLRLNLAVKLPAIIDFPTLHNRDPDRNDNQSAKRFSNSESV